MNLIKNIRLKFSNFFSKKELPTIDTSIVSNITKLKNEHLSEQEELDIMRHLAGLGKLRQQSALEKAHQKLIATEVDKEYKRLLKDPGTIEKAKKDAADKAQYQLERDENALAMATAMEGRNQKIHGEKNAFDESWSKYAKRHIRKRDPKAADFAKFLIKHDYIEKDLLDEVAVTAIFYDNEISNFNEFRIELKRVNELELIAA